MAITLHKTMVYGLVLQLALGYTISLARRNYLTQYQSYA